MFTYLCFPNVFGTNAVFAWSYERMDANPKTPTILHRSAGENECVLAERIKKVLNIHENSC